jgi:hypothetical protein
VTSMVKSKAVFEQKKDYATSI